MNNLIGLCGYARAGKDSVGHVLAGVHGFERLAFADKLRELAWEVNAIIEPTNKVTYREAIERHGYEGAKTLYPTALREYLVGLGAGARKVLGGAVWLDAALPASGIHGRRVVVTDVRYKNEADRIHELGGEVWWIDRKGIQAANQEEYKTIFQIRESGAIDRVLKNHGSAGDIIGKVQCLLLEDAVAR